MTDTLSLIADPTHVVLQLPTGAVWVLGLLAASGLTIAANHVAEVIEWVAARIRRLGDRP